MNNLDLEKWSERVLRWGMALVFLWFGANQLMDSSMWEGFVPLWIVDLGLSAKMLVMANGVMELILGTMLLFGVFVRVAALILALHLMGIAATIGFNATGVRDFGLAIATLAIAMRGK
ncbi:DoxX family membrane protein [Candidatus Gracilibacteria bacterium]|nr:DoxX family membrane protein [Candidatus Gracilibacteria bacterium]